MPDAVFIRPAAVGEYAAVRGLYHAVIDGMRNAPFDAKWEKDIYPAPAFLQTSIQKGELYMAYLGDALVGCMVLNHQCHESYRQVAWAVPAADAQVLFVHSLGVLPGHTGQGIAGVMVRAALDTAKAGGMTAVRLDVLQGNLPALRVYTREGFVHRGTVQVAYYDENDPMTFEMLEHLI